MKIIFCDNNLDMSLNFRNEVMQWFNKNGYYVIVVAPHYGKKYKAPFINKFYDIRMSPSGSSISDDLRYYRTLRKIYEEEKPDVVINYTIKPNIYSSIAAKMNGIPSVDVVAGLGYVFEGNNIKMKLARLLYKWGLKSADKVFVLNEDNRNTLINGEFVKKTNVIQLPGGEGVDLSKFSPQYKSFDRIKFLMVARLLKTKGYLQFVEAARKVKEVYPEAEFALLGSMTTDSPDAISMEKLEKDIKNKYINYYGVTDTITEYFNEPNTVVVLPSYYHEGLNRSLMEACATGCPIITTDIPGCRETVDQGVNGFLVPVKDATALAEACIKFIELPKEKKIAMSIASRKKAEAQFDISNVIETYARVIGELIKKD